MSQPARADNTKLGLTFIISPVDHLSSWPSGYHTSLSAMQRSFDPHAYSHNASWFVATRSDRWHFSRATVQSQKCLQQLQQQRSVVSCYFYFNHCTLF